MIIRGRRRRMNRRKKAFSLKNILGPIAIASAIASIPFIGEYLRNRVNEAELERYKESFIDKTAMKINGDTLNINDYHDINASFEDAGKKRTLADIFDFPDAAALRSTEVYLVDEIPQPFGKDSCIVRSEYGERKLPKFYRNKKGKWCRTFVKNFHTGKDVVPSPVTVDGEETVDLNHPVYSVAGIVLEAGWKKREGKYVKIRAPDKAEYTYCHLSKTEIKSDEEIDPSQLTGYMGRTGHCIRGKGGAGGYHLHVSGRRWEGWDGFKKFNYFDPKITSPGVNAKREKTKKLIEQIVFAMNFH